MQKLDPASFKKVQSGTLRWEIGAEASAGKVAVEGTTGQVKQDKGYTVYIYSEGGASATWTLRAPNCN